MRHKQQWGANCQENRQGHTRLHPLGLLLSNSLPISSINNVARLLVSEGRAVVTLACAALPQWPQVAVTCLFLPRRPAVSMATSCAAILPNSSGRGPSKKAC